LEAENLSKLGIVNFDSNKTPMSSGLIMQPNFCGYARKLMKHYAVLKIVYDKKTGYYLL
jgi:hypothetical protein